MHINYTSNPNVYSNTALIGNSYIHLINDLLSGSVDITPETIVTLSIFAEAIVLHEELVSMEILFTSAYESDRILIDKLIKCGAYGYNSGYDGGIPIRGGLAEVFWNELQLYEEKMNISDDKKGSKTKPLGSMAYGENLGGTLNIVEFEYPEENITNDMLVHEKKLELARIHGLSIIDDIYFSNYGNQEYSFESYEYSFISSKRVSRELLNQIDLKRFEYIDKLKEYLGITYVGLPSIISIILHRAKSIDFLLDEIIGLREEMEAFRKKCTQLEKELRMEQKFLSQCLIIDEIKNLHNITSASLGIRNKKGKKTVKRRLLDQGIDVVSEVDPLSMASSLSKKVVSKVKDYNLQLKIPGYYDLYRMSFDVEDNLHTLKKLFGSSIDTRFLLKLNSMSSLYGKNSK